MRSRYVVEAIGGSRQHAQRRYRLLMESRDVSIDIVCPDA